MGHDGLLSIHRLPESPKTGKSIPFTTTTPSASSTSYDEHKTRAGPPQLPKAQPTPPLLSPFVSQSGLIYNSGTGGPAAGAPVTSSSRVGACAAAALITKQGTREVEGGDRGVGGYCDVNSAQRVGEGGGVLPLIRLYPPTATLKPELFGGDRPEMSLAPQKDSCVPVSRPTLHYRPDPSNI